MKIYLENIGRLGVAEIDLNGISLVASENNSGKSTVSKVIFVVIKVMSNINELVMRQKLSEMSGYLANISIRIENNIGFHNEEEEENDYLNLGSAFIDNENDKDVYYLIQSTISDINDTLRSCIIDYENKALVEENEIEWIENIKKLREMIEILEYDVSRSDYNYIEEMINKLETLIKLDSYTVYSRIFEMYFKTEFGSQLLNVQSELGKIIVHESNNEVLNLEIVKDGIKVRNFKNIYSSDVTYIESPYVFNDMSNKSAYPFGRRASRNLRLSRSEDIKKKLTEVNENESLLDELPTKYILEKIEDTIGGIVNYDKESSKFFFLENNYKTDFMNTASGIKQFAMLTLLIKNNQLKPFDVIIMDEPEVHLHPTWQVSFAEVIVMLAKELKLRIFINSHSSYFIEALKLFSRKYELEQETEFYAFEIMNNTSELKNVSNKLSEVFKRLNAPYKILDDLIVDDFMDGV